jgi:hypothetical protein
MGLKAHRFIKLRAISDGLPQTARNIMQGLVNS